MSEIEEGDQQKIKSVLKAAFQNQHECSRLAEQVGFRRAINVVGLRMAEEGILDEFSRLTFPDDYENKTD